MSIFTRSRPSVSPAPSAAATRAFDLNIEKILEHWTPAHAVRELIANALDEATLSGTRPPTISRDAGGVWHIRDYGRGLRYEHLTQNENREKLRAPDRVIGKFGIGLKDALAALDRPGIGVTITSRHGRITTRMERKHGFDEIATLHAVVEDASDPRFSGTDVALRGIKDTDIEAAKKFFLAYTGTPVLERTSFGQILDPQGGTARIYVNGMEVAQEDNFLFSYNITAADATLRKALNRERTSLGRTAYAARVQAILRAANDAAVTGRLADDLRAQQTGHGHDELNWAEVRLRATQILNARDRVIFVTAEELQSRRDLVDRAARDGYQPVVVPENTRARLGGAVDIAGAEVRELNAYTREWEESFQFQWIEPHQLTPRERAIWDRTDDLLRLIGSRPAAVRSIRISANMRPDHHGFDVDGLWEPEEGRVVIRRTCLDSLPRFAGILLHEVAHARSGEGDVSREFESELTGLLGRAAARAVEQAGMAR